MLRPEVLNIYIFVVCLSQIYTVRCQNPCVDRNSCKCTFKDGRFVDLSSLGKTDSTPRFKDVVSPDGNLYSFNPCYGFNEGSGCTNAALLAYRKVPGSFPRPLNCWSPTYNCGNTKICLITTGHPTHFLFAKPSDGYFQNDPVSKKLVLYYFNQDAGVPAIVDLICDEKAQDPLFRANGLQTTGLSLSLTSKWACINEGFKATGSISAGTVLCIIFFTLLLAYIIGGMVFMRVRKNASGLEMVPNVTLWKSIPGLIKDGVMFSVGRPFRSSNYQKI